MPHSKKRRTRSSQHKSLKKKPQKFLKHWLDLVKIDALKMVASGPSSSSSHSSHSSSSSDGSGGGGGTGATVDSVTFLNGSRVNSDGSGQYSTPEWTDSSYSNPYLYQVGTALTVSAVFRFSYPDAPDTVLVQAYALGGYFYLPPTSASLDEYTGLITVDSITDPINMFPSVQYYNDFDIVWQVSFDGGVTYLDAGFSSNQIFVTRATPGSSGVTPYDTTLFLACYVGGATDAPTAVANTWSIVSGLRVCKYDSSGGGFTIPLYYYEPGTTFSQNAVSSSSSATALLSQSNCSGQCSAWAGLLYDAWLINGASSNYVTATPLSPYTGFIVKDWGSVPSGGYFEFQSSATDMIPYPSGGRYGYYSPGTDFQNQTTAQGQNSGSDAPSQKAFGNHQFLKYAGCYYDPSYGLKYSDAADFQTKAIAALTYGVFPSPYPPNAVLSGHAVTGTTYIHLSV